MAIKQLNEEQVRTWTRAQKDEWWFKNVFRGNMPQLTIRSGITGFLLGGVLAATALYIAAKTGISIGVGLTSVILAFALYRIMHGAGIATDFTILENNCTQSIATAAGYMVSPLIASLAAYMMVTDRIIPWWHMIIWMCAVSILGVLVAFPMKRRFINEEQLPFPEGRASGVVLDALYTGAAHEGMFKARLLAFTALFTGTLSGRDQRWLDEAAAVQDPAYGPVGRDEGAVDIPRAPRFVLLRHGRQGEPVHPDHSRYRHPGARPAAYARCGDARGGRPYGHRGRDQLPAGRVHQFRHPCTDHDPGGRHRRPRRA